MVGRGIQAAGTAVMPQLMTTLMQVVPERDRGRVMGNVTLAISVAPALGPAISGLILQLGSWRLIFAFVLPVAIAVTLFGLRHLTDVGESKSDPVSWVSVALAGFGFAALVYGLSEIGARSGAQLSAIIGIGVILVAAFVGYQLRLQRSGSPLMDLRTLVHRDYAVTPTLMAVAFMAFLGSMILLPCTCRICAPSRLSRPACWSCPAVSRWACWDRGSAVSTTARARAHWSFRVRSSWSRHLQR